MAVFIWFYFSALVSVTMLLRKHRIEVRSTLAETHEEGWRDALESVRPLQDQFTARRIERFCNTEDKSQNEIYIINDFGDAPKYIGYFYLSSNCITVMFQPLDQRGIKYPPLEIFTMPKTKSYMNEYARGVTCIEEVSSLPGNTYIVAEWHKQMIANGIRYKLREMQAKNQIILFEEYQKIDTQPGKGHHLDGNQLHIVKDTYGLVGEFNNFRRNHSLDWAYISQRLSLLLRRFSEIDLNENWMKELSNPKDALRGHIIEIHHWLRLQFAKSVKKIEQESRSQYWRTPSAHYEWDFVKRTLMFTTEERIKAAGGAKLYANYFYMTFTRNAKWLNRVKKVLKAQSRTLPVFLVMGKAHAAPFARIAGVPLNHIIFSHIHNSLMDLQLIEKPTEREYEELIEELSDKFWDSSIIEFDTAVNNGELRRLQVKEFQRLASILHGIDEG